MSDLDESWTQLFVKRNRKFREAVFATGFQVACRDFAISRSLFEVEVAAFDKNSRLAAMEIPEACPLPVRGEVPGQVQ